MWHIHSETPDTDALAQVFEDAFTASEGAQEGRLIRDLVKRLIETTPAEDQSLFWAEGNGVAAACILFTRLRYADDTRQVRLLSPVAVRPAHQGKGLGQQLIRHGLEQLRRDGVEVALTYGDPQFYSKIGFRQISTDDAAAPYPLGQPHGWLGQSLRRDGFAPLKGPVDCAPAWNDPALW